MTRKKNDRTLSCNFHLFYVTLFLVGYVFRRFGFYITFFHITFLSQSFYPKTCYLFFYRLSDINLQTSTLCNFSLKTLSLANYASTRISDYGTASWTLSVNITTFVTFKWALQCYFLFQNIVVHFVGPYSTSCHSFTVSNKKQTNKQKRTWSSCWKTNRFLSQNTTRCNFIKRLVVVTCCRWRRFRSSRARFITSVLTAWRPGTRSAAAGAATTAPRGTSVSPTSGPATAARPSSTPWVHHSICTTSAFTSNQRRIVMSDLTSDLATPSIFQCWKTQFRLGPIYTKRKRDQKRKRSKNKRKRSKNKQEISAAKRTFLFAFAFAWSEHLTSICKVFCVQHTKYMMGKICDNTSFCV